MSDNPNQELTGSDREITAQAGVVNQLLHDLEPMLDDSQHYTVTELLAERAVLAAMRARVELEEATKRQNESSTDGEKAPEAKGADWQ